MLNEMQSDYQGAVRLLQSVESTQAEIEALYCKRQGYGCDKVHEIMNEAEFERANAEFDMIVRESGLWREVYRARVRKEKAEADLIGYALSIIPSSEEREFLKAASITNSRVRKQIIDLMLKLDTTAINVQG